MLAFSLLDAFNLLQKPVAYINVTVGAVPEADSSQVVASSNTTLIAIIVGVLGGLLLIAGGVIAARYIRQYLDYHARLADIKRR